MLRQAIILVSWIGTFSFAMGVIIQMEVNENDVIIFLAINLMDTMQK